VSIKEQSIDPQATGQIIHGVIYNLHRYLETKDLDYLTRARTALNGFKKIKQVEAEKVTEEPSLTLADIPPIM